MRNYSIFALTLVAALASGCVQYDAQSAQGLRDGIGPGTLCGALSQARQMNDSDSVNALVSEYARRNPSTDERTMTRLRAGNIGPGMPEHAAICAWNATLVNHSIGFGQSTKQYRGAGGSSFFFVNGRTGRVDYVSA